MTTDAKNASAPGTFGSNDGAGVVPMPTLTSCLAGSPSMPNGSAGGFNRPFGKQAKADHPLAKYGHHRLPHWLWRLSPRLHCLVAAIRDIWLIAAGRITLHVAWQEGHNHGTACEYHRTVIMGGR